jgi:hypothetical protein
VSLSRVKLQTYRYLRVAIYRITFVDFIALPARVWVTRRIVCCLCVLILLLGALNHWLRLQELEYVDSGEEILETYPDEFPVGRHVVSGELAKRLWEDLIYFGPLNSALSPEGTIKPLRNDETCLTGLLLLYGMCSMPAFS